MTQVEQLQAEIAALKAANAKLTAPKAVNGMKVSQKGALSVYGLGRFPVTLYKEQWLTLLDKANDIREFITANEATLATKPTEE